jgi:hypothetical protein
MKFAIYFSVVVAASVAVQRSSRATDEVNAESICGELGVMKINADDLPDGASPKDVRMCAKHPHGRNRTLDPSEGASLPPAYASMQNPPGKTHTEVSHINGRSGDSGSPFGCSRGWCWRSCGTPGHEGGKWCWAAAEHGTGEWKTCKNWHQCGSDDEDFGCSIEAFDKYGCAK